MDHYDMEIDLYKVVTIFSVKVRMFWPFKVVQNATQIFCVTEVLCSTLESAKGSLVISSWYTFGCCT